MKNTALKILNKIERSGITYADVRLTSTDNEGFHFERGALKGMGGQKDSVRVGIRVLAEGTWGFAAGSDISDNAVDAMIKKATDNAKKGSRFQAERDEFKPIKGIEKEYRFKPEIDPFTMPLEEKLAYLEKLAKMIAGDPNIPFSIVDLMCYRQHKVFVNTEGMIADTVVYDIKPSMMVIAVGPGGVMSRTFPGHMEARRGGFEVLKQYDFEGNAERIMKEAAELLTAKGVEDDEGDIIIGAGHLALQLHESVGHATEADRIFGMEISYAGKTFVKPSMIGNFKYGSDILTIYTDASDERGIGFHPVDDEGVPAKRVDIIKNGVLKDLQTSRQIADKLGLEPSSNMKASFASDFPLVRMTNLCIEPVKGSLKEMIAGTENGYLVDFTKTWSIDDNRNNFQFTTEIGWKIKNGKIERVVREPTYFGITKEFWNSCDAICGPEEWNYYGTFFCGKGEPGQAMHLSHGVAPARFRKVKLLKSY